jgi:hypothetical protein
MSLTLRQLRATKNPSLHRRLRPLLFATPPPEVALTQPKRLTRIVVVAGLNLPCLVWRGGWADVRGWIH